MSLWACPGACDLAGCREPRSRPFVLLKPLPVKSYGEWENGCVNLAFEGACSSLIARVKCTRPDSDKPSALMPLYSVFFFISNLLTSMSQPLLFSLPDASVL